MAYRVMQQTEDGMEFCAKGGFATYTAADSWIDDNQSNWPESNFYVDADAVYPRDYHNHPEFEDVPW